MTGRRHHYSVELDWTGNRGDGTSAYGAYGREHRLTVAGKSAIGGSADPAFRGDASLWNPEELLVASLSACHQLWFLHLAADAGLIVTAYRDEAEGEMVEDGDGGGAFTRVVLRPRVTAQPRDHAVELARHLHHQAHERCFIARSVRFPVTVEGELIIA